PRDLPPFPTRRSSDLVDTAEELKNAINKRTAMIYIMAGGPSEEGPLSTRAIAEIAKPHNIPILVDAAAEDLTVPNVHLADGADRSEEHTSELQSRENI